MPILECRELSKRFGRTQALDHISLNIEAGRVVGLLGPNGSGCSRRAKGKSSSTARPRGRTARRWCPICRTGSISPSG